MRRPIVRTMPKFVKVVKESFQVLTYGGPEVKYLLITYAAVKKNVFTTAIVTGIHV